MGKERKRNKTGKILKESLNPVGIVSVEEAQRREEEQQRSEPVSELPPVIKNLDSVNSGDREQACISLAVIVLENNGEHVPFLVRTKAIHKLIQLLLDPCKPVRSAATGALRNLVIVGGEEACDLLVKQDVLTTLGSALVQSIQTLMHLTKQTIVQNEKKIEDMKYLQDMMDSEEQQSNTRENNEPIDEYHEALHILYQVIILLSFLCENSEQATVKITNGNYLEKPFSFYFMQMLTEKKITEYQPLLKMILQCLNVITDENESFNIQLNNMNVIQVLFGIANDANNNNIYIRISAGSILFNISQSLKIPLLQTVNMLFGLLREAFVTIDCVKSLGNLLPVIISYRGQQNEKSNIEELQSKEDNELLEHFEEENSTIHTPEYKQWKTEIKAQKLSFEICANIISTYAMAVDDGKIEDFDDEASEEEQIDQRYTQETPKELMEFLLQTNLLGIIIEKCIALSQQGSIEQGAALIESELAAINETLLRGLNCLANIILEMDKNLLCRCCEVSKLWTFIIELSKFSYQKLATLLTRQQPRQETCKHLFDRLEVLTGIMWSILRSKVLQQSDTNLLFQAVPFFVELSNLEQNEEIRTNSIGILGEIGQIPHSFDDNRKLAQLLSAKLSDSSLSVLSETLNAVFDVYGDSNYDTVLSESGLLKRLQVFVGLMQQRIQQNMNNVPKEVILRAKEARLNLQRFIKYKGNL